MLDGFALAISFLAFALSSQADELRTDFENGFGPWTPLFSGAWQIDEVDGDQVATLAVAGEERPPVRRPRAYLFLEDHSWKDYTLTCEARTLMPSTDPRRDIVLIFGYLDDTHYYYAHISSIADGVHSVIMKVEGTSRTTIHREEEVIPALLGGWQTLRVSHESTGSIRIYVDDMVNPSMTAEDTTYPAGAVALGSFDNLAQFDDIVILGSLLAQEPSSLSIRPTEGPLFEVEIGTAEGFVYQVESATNPDDFAVMGEPILGNGSMATMTLDSSRLSWRFFRVGTFFPQLAEP